MSLTDKSNLNFDPHLPCITSACCIEDQPAADGDCPDSFQATVSALNGPADFPPMTAAIVPGDHVAIALDPNTPEVCRILAGVLQVLQESDAETVSVIVSDEVSDRVFADICSVAGDTVQVEIHRPSDREALRFLGPDSLAHPMYLSRLVVDADFVLPITTGRCGDLDRQHDLFGFFPSFSDSASRLRSMSLPNAIEPDATDPHEPAWALGAQLILCVTATRTGEAANVIAGTPIAIRKHLQESRFSSSQESPTSLIVATLDGNQQQQTWQNIARAAATAAQLAEQGGTIVLWSNIAEAPTNSLLSIMSEDDLSTDSEPLGEDEFPEWDPLLEPAKTLRSLIHEYRILLRSQLSPEDTESLGMGVIGSADELSHLTRSFSACRVLRAASFCCSSATQSQKITVPENQ